MDLNSLIIFTATVILVLVILGVFVVYRRRSRSDPQPSGSDRQPVATEELTAKPEIHAPEPPPVAPIPVTPDKSEEVSQAPVVKVDSPAQVESNGKTKPKSTPRPKAKAKSKPPAKSKKKK